jgi:plasmid maintenance system antidote protein VapI
MSLRKSAVRARDLSEQVRRQVPAVAEVEADLCTILARNILQSRNQRGMTQRELARALGVSQPRIAEIEGARTSARIDTVGRLAAVFGVEPWTLLRRRQEYESWIGSSARDDGGAKAANPVPRS